ncbi:MAG: NAD(P)H-hydrate dehydratase [Anaerolineae bacterium]|nr:NAD(P)H-hydrate dehydratase [Anaerolineae bacterium]MCI0607623.1 NAD(P)H-hydrate dehydratase [Anaerolineae bacterium]
MKLVTVPQMQAIEKEADAGGLTYDQMMQNAGQGLANIILDLFVGEEEQEAVGLVGSGNNGGDTLVALTALVGDGWKARAYLVKRKKDDLIKKFVEAGGEVIPTEKDDALFHLSSFLDSADVLLDGILGTGIKLPLKKDVAELLSEVNDVLDGLEARPLVIAVDCPSGVDCDTGEVAEETIPADLTVTMAAVKQGMLKLPAFEYVGNIQVVDIGLPDDLSVLKDLNTDVAEEDSISALLPERPLDSHKGTFGTALIAAGSVNYTGAVLLAAEAAYRAGAGLVTLAVPGPVHAALAGQIPEATWVVLPQAMGVISSSASEVLVKNIERATALLIGPGFGMETTTKEFIENLLAGKSVPKKSTARIGFLHEENEKREETNNVLPPMVVDADGLKLLAQIKDWHTKLPAPAILTPHPGEMAVLTGLSKEEIQEDRQEIARKYAKEWGHIIVLKGAFTAIASPDGRVTVIPVASPALARAGTGDVLAGLIVGLRAQGLDAFDAAVAAAWIHAQAGLYAADDLGTTASVLASDVLNSVSDVLSDLE